MDFYNVCVLDKDGKVSQTYEFTGQYANFSESSLQIPMQIYTDDSIRAIKKKIIQAFSINNIQIAYDEIYLFIRISESLPLKQIFDSVFKFGDTIDTPIFSQLLQNLGYSSIELKKPAYSYSDFLNILSSNPLKTYPIISRSLGLKFSREQDLAFPMNPYEVLSNFKYNSSAKNPLLSLENSLLSGAIRTDKLETPTIYVCLAENILQHFERIQISEDLFSYYFPALSKKNILSIPDLIRSKQSLLKDSKKITDTKSIQVYKNIELLYDIYREDGLSKPLPYVEKGIQSINLCIHPDDNIQIPIDIIFKTIHATVEVPFIKYNPGTRRENIYRLYSTHINKYGAKVPDLNRAKIIQLSKELQTGLASQITMFLQYSGDIEIIITISNKANIYISVISKISQQIEEIEEILKGSVNSILSKIDYPLPRFNSLFSPTTEIRDINYFWKLPIQRKFGLFKEGYIESVFHVIDENPTRSGGANLKYRRVENYEEMNAESSMILDWFNETIEKIRLDREELVRKLMDFSSISRDQALMKMDIFLRDHTIINGKYINSGENVLENSGFLTNILIELEDDTVVVKMEAINSISYIKPIEILIDSILRLKQYPDLISQSLTDRISDASKHITNIKTVDKSHVDTVVIVGVGVGDNNIQALQFGKSNHLSIFENEDEYSDETIEEKGIEFEDDDQNPVTVLEDKDTMDFFNNLDEYQDAEFDFEILDDSDNDSEKEEEMKLPEASVEANADIDQEEDSDDDSEGGIFFEGGTKDSFPYYKGGSSYERELDGKPLKTRNDNIILSRLKNREKRLFLSTDSENKFFNRYSRICPAFRQPVILSDEEKRKVDAKDTENQMKYGNTETSYAKAIQYGTDPKSLNWYTCPRYWCLKTNMPLTQTEVDSGVCGKIIPQGSKTIPPGHYIYEFNKGTQHSNPDGSYRDNVPGFLVNDNHPDGYCIPCCFKEWNKPQKAKQEQCMGKTDPKSKVQAVGNKQNTILKIESIPLDQGRYGFLPLSIQRFLRINNQSAVQPDNPSVLKADGETMLRVGVIQHPRKSFIGCIADLYSRKRKIVPPVTIEKMCANIADAVSLDIFVTANNGALPSVFKQNKNNKSQDSSLDESMFKKTINMENNIQRDFYEQTVTAYNNFKEFLINEANMIDYTYLWDIVCMPNPKLFESGINLAILDITQNDFTDNVALICPSSAYSKTYYNPNKETLIILKANTIFEPIYLINAKKDEPTYTFFEAHTLNETLKKVLHIIRYSSQNYCSPINSIPQYEFKRNKLAEEVYLNLLRQTDKKPAYEVVYQIQSYQGKTIGFYVVLENRGSDLELRSNMEESGSKQPIFVPCLPSATLSSIPIEYIDNEELWQPYEETRNTLLQMKQESGGLLLTQPIFKVIEDGLIIGIITETNQFIQLSKPTENIFEDSLKPLTSANYIAADEAIARGEQDITRIRAIKKIELESMFYSAFRSFIQIILQDPENKKSKNRILRYIHNKEGKHRTYILEKIKRELQTICANKIQFAEYDEDDLFSLHKISNCQDKSDIGKSYCFTIANTNKRGLIIPKTHLTSGLENQIIYFNRISDELFRYRRIQPYLLPELTKHSPIFNLKNTEYQLNNDELLLLQSFLTREYFEDFIPFSQNRSTNITYEFAQQDPRISQKYSDNVEYSKQMSKSDSSIDSEIDILCIKSTVTVAGNPATSIWKQMLPETSQELLLTRDRRECSFYPIIFIFRDLYKTDVTIPQIRQTLRHSYMTKYIDHFDKILILLKKQGKKEMVNRILKQSTDDIKYTVFEEWILNESYYLTDLDLWVLAQENNLPIILFTSTSLKNLLESVSWLILGRNEKTARYYFIRAYASLDKGEYHDYRIINPSVKLNELRQFKSPEGRLYLKDLIERGYSGDSKYENNVITLNNYFENHSFTK